MAIAQPLSPWIPIRLTNSLCIFEFIQTLVWIDLAILLWSFWKNDNTFQITIIIKKYVVFFKEMLNRYPQFAWKIDEDDLKNWFSKCKPMHKPQKLRKSTNDFILRRLLILFCTAIWWIWVRTLSIYKSTTLSRPLMSHNQFRNASRKPTISLVSNSCFPFEAISRQANYQPV